MKKVLLITVLCALCSVLCAQRGPIIGVGGSVNSVWVLYPNAYAIPEFAQYKGSNYKSTIGGDYYVAFNQNFVDVFGIRVELQSSTQGQDYEYTDNQNRLSSKNITLNYTQIPIMVRLTTPGQKVKMHLMFGPQIGFLSSASQTGVVYKGDYNIANYQIANGGGILTGNNQQGIGYLGEEDISNRYKGMDFLLVAEIGTDIFIMDRLFVNLGLRVHYGFTDINDKAWQFNTANVSYHSSNNIYGGITFGINYILKYWYR